MADERNINGVTYKEWLERSQDPIPEGFTKWDGAWGHWNVGSPVGWAIYCFHEKQAGRTVR